MSIISRVKIIALMSLTSILSLCLPVRSTSNSVLENPSLIKSSKDYQILALQNETSTQGKTIDVAQSTSTKAFGSNPSSAQDFSSALQPLIYSVLPLMLGLVTMAIVTAFRNRNKAFVTIEETSKGEVFDLYRKETEELLIDQIISSNKVELAKKLNKKPEELDIELKELVSHLINKK